MVQEDYPREFELDGGRQDRGGADQELLLLWTAVKGLGSSCIEVGYQYLQLAADETQIGYTTEHEDPDNMHGQPILLEHPCVVLFLLCFLPDQVSFPGIGFDSR